MQQSATETEELRGREVQEFRRVAEEHVSGVLHQFVRYTITSGVHAVSLSEVEDRIQKDPTVPTDLRCWLLQVAKMLAQLDRTVYARGTLLLYLRLVERRKWREISDTMRLSVETCKEQKDRSLFAFWFDCIHREISRDIYGQVM